MDDATRKPFLGELVHYVSFGTPKGEYAPQCRAAMITELGQWITVATEKAKSYSRSEGRAIRILEQWYYHDAASVVAFNPTGLFFNGAGPVACKHDESERAGGTWHWPDERCAP